MIYKIADLYTEVPEAGGLAPRCQAYLHQGEADVDIIINTEHYRPELYPDCKEDAVAYMESCSQFYSKILAFNGLFLHASAVEYKGRAYLFSAPSGTGKSTHTRIWQQVFGENARVFNDDKPALRCLDGKWFAYGTPWCGKDGININMKVPLAGITFLQQSPENRIRRLSKQEALTKIFTQTFSQFQKVENLDLMLAHVDKLVRQIPVFELCNRPEPAAAQLSYETMRRAAEEEGL